MDSLLVFFVTEDIDSQLLRYNYRRLASRDQRTNTNSAKPLLDSVCLKRVEKERGETPHGQGGPEDFVEEDVRIGMVRKPLAFNVRNPSHKSWFFRQGVAIGSCR